MSGGIALPLPETRRANPAFASVLFVAILLFGLLSLNLYADLANPEGRSLALDQFTALALAAGALLCVAQSGSMPLVLQPRAIIVLVFAWLAVTAMGAPEPATALRRLFIAGLVCVAASSLLVLPASRRHFAMLLALCVMIVLTLCYFGVLALPGRAIHQPGDIVEPALAGDWRGVFQHKNYPAPAMVILVFFSLYLAAAWSAAAGWALAALALLFLLQTNGKSAMGLLPLALVMAGLLVRWPRLGASLLVLLVLAFNTFTVGAALVPAIRDFVQSLGVDATFTSRADVWTLATSAIAERPITGYGFDSFWGTQQLLDSGATAQTWAVNAAHAHNSYIEVMLDGGVPALLLAVVWLVLLPLRDVAKAARRGADRHLTELYARIWVFALFLSCLESFFFRSSGIMWFVLLMAVFGLRLQAEADLATDEAPAHA